MSYQTIEVRKSTPNIGAEILGIDLSEPLNDQQFQEVHDVLMDRLVIFFCDQTLTSEQQLAFGRRFGRLHVHPAAPPARSGQVQVIASKLDQPEILVIRADEKSHRVAGEEWHSDVSCDPEPPMGSVLYITEIPPDGGGDTLFANMYLAYETLSEPIKKLLHGLRAVHDGEHVMRGSYGVDDSGKVFPRSEHPIVRTHPVTGRKALFVNRNYTTSIVGLRRRESDSILEMLYRHMETPQFSMRFKWQPNSVAFWDNRCVVHQALWDYYPNTRLGHRVTICGDEPH